MFLTSSRKYNSNIALLLIFFLGFGSVKAGINIVRSNGVTMTGADGVTFTNPSGVTMTGADGFLSYNANGITMTGADSAPLSTSNGYLYTGTNGVTAIRANGVTMTGADGVTMTGADGVTMTGADGSRYIANSVIIHRPNGVTMTGADGVTMTGADGVTMTGADGVTMTGADGVTMTGADGVTMTGADEVIAISPNGNAFNVNPNGVTMTGADSISVVKANGVTMTGADGLSITSDDSLSLNSNYNSSTGLQSIDPELALLLNNLTDDSNVNAVIVYHHLPNENDIADLTNLGITGGIRYRLLPVIAVTTTKSILIEVSRLAAVRSIYSNRTLLPAVDPRLNATVINRVRTDSDLTNHNSGLPVSGRNITVAVLDTGIDATHADLSGRVVQNVKLLDTQSIGVGFNPPVNVENLQNTDLVNGHGTFVAGIAAGNGVRAGGKFDGIAPGANLLGLGAGDFTLNHVLAGFDYLLQNATNYNVKVVNCSFSANTVFDFNDPVNIATKMLVDNGINVVFSAGNTGPGLHTLNPYSIAPWVISVGATDDKGKIAEFSSRGQFNSAIFRPTIVAPGVGVVSLRSSNLGGITGVSGILLGNDSQRLSPSELPFYTTASGTSFSAPQVAGAIALMLQVNPNLSPGQIKKILQRTATPLPNQFEHEVGSGMLNVHAAVLTSAFPERQMGLFRLTMNFGQVKFVNDPAQFFSGTAMPQDGYENTLQFPANTLSASLQIAWGGLNTNDLGLTLKDPNGMIQGQSNSINLPGLTGKRERISLVNPNAGNWRYKVFNSLSPIGTPQQFNGILETTRAEYTSLRDLDGLSPITQKDIYLNIRSFVMRPNGKHFKPNDSVTRSEMATVLVLAGCAPQYLSGRQMYNDVRDLGTRGVVESVQSAPDSPLFYDAVQSNNFRPNERVSRLVAAVALVRAAGLRADAESHSGVLTLLDTNSIPSSLRGYVAVAISNGLIQTNGNLFNVNGSITRAELATAMATIKLRN